MWKFSSAADLNEVRKILQLLLVLCSGMFSFESKITYLGLLISYMFFIRLDVQAMAPSMVIIVILLGGIVIYTTCLMVASCPESTSNVYLWDVYL